MERLLGNAHINELVRSNSKIGGTFLFEGPRGSGKKTAAFLVAAALMCREENAPCGRCGPCVRMQAGSHPDYEFISAVGGMKASEARELRTRSFLAPSEADSKVFVIDHAELMNEAAQNILLKTLEEPRSSVFILLCENSQKLLLTVRSRCTVFRMEPLSEALIESELRRRVSSGKTDFSEAVKNCGGYLGRAIELCEGETDESFRLAHDFLDAYAESEQALAAFCLSRLNAMSKDDYKEFCLVLTDETVKSGMGDNEKITICETLNKQLDSIERINASPVLLSCELSAVCGQLINSK